MVFAGLIYAVGVVVCFLWFSTMKGPVTSGFTRMKKEAFEALFWPLIVVGLLLLMSVEWRWRSSRKSSRITPLDSPHAINGFHPDLHEAPKPPVAAAEWQDDTVLQGVA